MGDRANVRIAGVHLYTHWGGHALPFSVRDSLRRKWRWTDEAYLARIIFCDMIAGSEQEETGFGISKNLCDNEYPIINVDTDTQTVQFLAWSFADGVTDAPPLLVLDFEAYAKLDDEQLKKVLEGIKY